MNQFIAANALGVCSIITIAKRLDSTRSIYCTIRLENHELHAGIWNDHGHIAQAIINGDPLGVRDLATHHADSAGQMTYTRLTDLETQ